MWRLFDYLAKFWKFCFLFPAYFKTILSLMGLNICLSHPDSAHPRWHWSFPCHHPPHPPSSSPECCRSFSNRDSGGLSYQANRRDPRKSQSLGNSEEIWHIKYNQKRIKNKKIIKPNKNKFPFRLYKCFFYPVWQSDPSPGLTFSKPGIQNMCLQQALNKTLCLTPPPPTR